MSGRLIYAFNAGSSTLKAKAYVHSKVGGGLEIVSRLYATRHENGVALAIHSGNGDKLRDAFVAKDSPTSNVVIHPYFEVTNKLCPANQIVAGHRIVHGGPMYASPLIINEDVLEAIEKLMPLAPLHQPACIEPYRAIKSAHPDWMQAAVFDTAFHTNMPERATRIAIPSRFVQAGIRRYGFHGLSYEYVLSRLAMADAAIKKKRIIIAHLGSGSSLCAIRDGHSIETTMGFSALDGLVMSTRPGTIDPGVLIHLQRSYDMDLESLERLLYHESGLRAVSGASGDMKALLANPSRDAAKAVDLYVYRTIQHVGALAAALGGLDLLVFTGGVGENSEEIRQRICSSLEWLGVVLDQKANVAHSEELNSTLSAVQIRLIPTDEEYVIALHTDRLAHTRIS